MKVSVKELLEQRSEIAAEMSKIHEKATAEERSFSDDEQKTWDEREAKIKTLDSAIERQRQIELVYSTWQGEDEERERFEERRKSHSSDDKDKPLSPWQRNRALRAWMCRGQEYEGRSEDMELMRRAGFNIDSNELDLRLHRGVSESGEEFRAPKTIMEAGLQAEVRFKTSREERATQITGTANLGGHTVPDEMMRPLESALLWYGGMRQAASILSTNTGASIPMPTENDTSNTGEIIAENAAVNEQAIPFGQITMNAYKYSSKMIPISVELLQDSATNMVELIGRKVGERIGRITNTHFTTGTNSSQPNGIVTAAANSGVTAATSNKFDWDELLSLVHSIDPAYRQQDAKFMLHDTTLKLVKQLKDSQGRPIWLPSIIPGEPDTLHGYQYIVNNSMPSGASSKAIIFGALGKYLIREVKGITLLRLNERYAEFHRVAFLAFARYDGELMDAGTNPVKYMTQAA